MRNRKVPTVPQGPYRQSAGPREADARDVSVGFVIGFVALLIVLIRTLATEPLPTEGFGGFPDWHSVGHGCRARSGHRR